LQLSNTEALEGLVAPASSYVLLGQAGPVLIIIICFMAVTSSGASEMVAISSLFTFDVYRRYINPRVHILLSAVQETLPEPHST
jgi:Na+/proline symporter